MAYVSTASIPDSPPGVGYAGNAGGTGRLQPVHGIIGWAIITAGAAATSLPIQASSSNP